MLPDVLVVEAHRDSKSHDRLCDAVLDDAGYIILSDRLYEIVEWHPIADASWSWRLVVPYAHATHRPIVC
jgi:hypothetical protein